MSHWNIFPKNTFLRPTFWTTNFADTVFGKFSFKKYDSFNRIPALVELIKRKIGIFETKILNCKIKMKVRGKKHMYMNKILNGQKKPDVV